MSSALGSPSAWCRFLLTTALGLSADLATKYLAFAHLKNGETFELIPGWLEFQATINHGAVFGMGQGQRALFIGVSIAAIFFLFWLFIGSEKRWVYQILLGMLLAGVMGNFYDRVELGYVRDMIHVLPRWPHFFPWIFNVADSLLCVGVFLMIIYNMVSPLSPAPRGIEVPNPQDEARHMQRAMQLAMRGRGSIEPGAMVGCVIVKDGKVLAEGYHERFGGPHAEAAALNTIDGSSSAAGATVHVTLEPCCHSGKKTPPCVPRLIQAGVARVVVGCSDPNPQVNGKGISQLISAGIRVDQSPLEDACRQLNAAYFKRVQTSRPYVTLKWAQTADGKMAAAPALPRMIISNEQSLAAAHRLRAHSDAIVVGIRTVLADDPLLTARPTDGTREGKAPLLRVVLDGQLRIPASSRLVASTQQGPVLIYCAAEVSKLRPAAVEALSAHGATVVPIPTDSTGALSLAHLLEDLGGRCVTHLLVEPGATLAASFLQQGLADRVWIFRSKMLADDANAVPAPKVGYAQVGQTALGDDQLGEYLNAQSPAYFAATPSADLESLYKND